MSVVMFAMIGAAINPHWAYWVAFGLYCLIWLDKYLDVDVKKGEQPMIDFIVKLEDMLRLSGYKDWEIQYLPKEKVYSLKLDGDTILMREVIRKEK